MLSPPTSIDPITDSAFEPLFAACFARRRRESISPAKSIRCARIAAGSSPAFDTRFVSSKLTETRLSSCDARTQQVPFHLTDSDPSARSSSQVEGHLRVYGTLQPAHHAGGSGLSQDAHALTASWTAVAVCAGAEGVSRFVGADDRRGGGNPAVSVSSPMVICGSIRRSLENPGSRNPSPTSVSK